MKIVALLLAAAFASACRSAQPVPVASAPTAAQTPDPSVLSTQEGLRTMRMVLSAQMSRPKGSDFVPLADVLKAAPALPAQAAAVDPDTAALKGYRLRMTLSEDKRHFQTSLTPEKGCGRSWFSSEQNVIYVGAGLDCASPN
jgi:hypothetical protein